MRWSECWRRLPRTPARNCGRSSAQGWTVGVAAGRSSTPTVAQADEIVVPVQINGKVRSRLTVPADDAGVGARGARARRPGVQGAHAGEDDQEGRRREREACLSRGSVEGSRCEVHGCRLTLVAVVRWRSGRVRLRARRPWLVPARLHQGRRHPAVRESQQLLSGRADPHREGAHRVHRSRQVHASSPTRRDPTPFSPGRSWPFQSSPSASPSSSWPPGISSHGR